MFMHANMHQYLKQHVLNDTRLSSKLVFSLTAHFFQCIERQREFGNREESYQVTGVCAIYGYD